MEDFDPLDDEQQQEIADASEKKKNLAKLQEIADFRWLMDDPRGRRQVWRWLSDAGVFQQSFNPDAMTMAFKEGRRAAGLQLLGQIHAICPDHYTTMMKEQQP